MMSRWCVLALLALFGGAVTSSATAQWAWRDPATGQTNYSDRPPPADISEKNILKRPNQAASISASKPPASASSPEVASLKLSGVDTSLQAKLKEAKEKEATQRKLEEDKMAALKLENCNRTRNHLTALTNGIRMSTPNANGEQEAMDDTSRAKEMKRASDVLATNCK